jgi:hypothetical protein
VDIELYNFCPLQENRIRVDMTSIILQSVNKQQTGERSPAATGIEISPQGNCNTVGGLAGLLLKKAKKTNRTRCHAKPE